MKKTMSILSIFLLACIVGAGLSLLTADNAQAVKISCFGPDSYYVLSCDTGPNCPNPNWPYYMYICDPNSNCGCKWEWCHADWQGNCN